MILIAPIAGFIGHLTAGRAQMGTSLAFHLTFAVLGVGLPLMMLVVEGMHLRTGDPIWLALARRWSKAFAILFAVGAVSGTIISFELGLLWPKADQTPLALPVRLAFLGMVGIATYLVAMCVWYWLRRRGRVDRG